MGNRSLYQSAGGTEMTNKILLFMGIFLLLFISIYVRISNCQEQVGIKKLRLQDCLELAVKNDPDAKNAQDQAGIGRLRLKDANRALFLPRIDLETTYAPKLDFFGRPITDENIYYSLVSLEKPIYKGGELVTAVKLAKSETIRAEYDYRQKAAKVMAEAVKKYYNLLASQENLRYHQELHQQGKMTVELVEKKFNLGAVTRVDLLEAEAKLNEIKYKLVKADGERQVAIADLNKIIGWENGVKTEVLEEFPLKSLSGNVRELVEMAKKGRPDLLYQVEDSNFNQLRLQWNKSKEWPTLSLVGSYAWEGNKFPGEDMNFMVMLKLSYSFYDTTLSSSASQNKLYENAFNFQRQDESYNMEKIKLSIFDGSYNQVSIEKARADMKLAINRLDQLRKSLVKDVNETFYQFKSTEAGIVAAEKSVEYEGEKLRVLEEKLKLKETTEVEVLKARVDLVDAQVKKIRSLYDNATALAELYKATGLVMELKGEPNG
jgi:outer membrane protein TolC